MKSEQDMFIKSNNVKARKKRRDTVTIQSKKGAKTSLNLAFQKLNFFKFCKRFIFVATAAIRYKIHSKIFTQHIYKKKQYFQYMIKHKGT